MNESQQLNTADQSFYKINREHKDCLFRLTFREKKDLLELYNAVKNPARNGVFDPRGSRQMPASSHLACCSRELMIPHIKTRRS